MRKIERAGKTYATVKLSHANPRYRNKTGEVTKIDGDKYQLYIDVFNTTSKSGSTTWLGVIKGGDGYQKVWFDINDLSEIFKYDENGTKIVK